MTCKLHLTYHNKPITDVRMEVYQILEIGYVANKFQQPCVLPCRSSALEILQLHH